MYQAIYSRKAEKAFLDLPDNEAKHIKEAIDKLKQQPRMPGTIKLENALIASYRFRVGYYRILFDIDDEAKRIKILAIRRRSGSTYK